MTSSVAGLMVANVFPLAAGTNWPSIKHSVCRIFGRLIVLVTVAMETSSVVIVPMPAPILAEGHGDINKHGPVVGSGSQLKNSGKHAKILPSAQLRFDVESGGGVALVSIKTRVTTVLLQGPTRLARCPDDRLSPQEMIHGK
jgi:hypothetical protein